MPVNLYYGGEITLPAGVPTKLVDSAEVDRTVYLSPAPTFFGFTSEEVTGRTVGIWPFWDSGSPVPMVLPAHKELWGNHVSRSVVGIVVTAIAH